VTQEEAEAAIEDIKRLALRFKPLFARGDAADPDPDTHIQLYKDVNVTDADVEQFIVDANNGNAFAKSFLYLLACARLSDATAPLDRWILSVLRDKATTRKKGKGRRRSSRWWVSFVSYAVTRVRECHPGLNLTKGHKSKTEVSVCWIVSEGLSRAGNPLGEARVAEIFTEQTTVVALPERHD
jgi:hypothetical protein